MLHGLCLRRCLLVLGGRGVGVGVGHKQAVRQKVDRQSTRHSTLSRHFHGIEVRSLKKIQKFAYLLDMHARQCGRVVKAIDC